MPVDRRKEEREGRMLRRSSHEMQRWSREAGAIVRVPIEALVEVQIEASPN